MKQRRTAQENTHNLEQDIVAFFEKKRVRWTPQRQLVLDTLQRSPGHISAEEIYQDIIKQFPRVNLSTVYRTLELLCEMGVMVEVDNPRDDRKRFELVGEIPHYHLVCSGCGGAVELDESVIQMMKSEMLKRYNFKLELNHFVGHGWCKYCQEQGLPENRLGEPLFSQELPGSSHTH